MTHQHIWGPHVDTKQEHIHHSHHHMPQTQSKDKLKTKQLTQTMKTSQQIVYSEHHAERVDDTAYRALFAPCRDSPLLLWLPSPMSPMRLLCPLSCCLFGMPPAANAKLVGSGWRDGRSCFNAESVVGRQVVLCELGMASFQYEVQAADFETGFLHLKGARLGPASENAKKRKPKSGKCTHTHTRPYRATLATSWLRSIAVWLAVRRPQFHDQLAGRQATFGRTCAWCRRTTDDMGAIPVHPV